MELWYTEKHTPAAGITLKCKRTLFSTTTRYQRIDVLETEEYGRMLLLDGLVMTTERDEFIYHEMLVHPAMHLHERAEEILVIGGGDGGAVRELLRYSFVKKVLLCEIDKQVVETSKKFFPDISCGLGDERVEIVFEDGSKILKDTERKFDIIIVDSTDPIGAAKGLFTETFYNTCNRALKEGGILCAQSESPIYHLPTMREMKEAILCAGFSFTRFYTAPIPTYPGGYWSWVVAGNGAFEIEKIKRRLLSEEGYAELKYFNPGLGAASFTLPNFLERAVGKP